MGTNAKHLLIGVTGSVATIKLYDLISSLSSRIGPNLSIKIIATEHSKNFFNPTEITKILNDDVTVSLLDDQDEWSTWNKLGDPVLHIELRNWADICVVAPIDANTMAKVANGICDNLLTCVIRAWNVSKPLIFCPAMNVHMYEHPLTRKHITELQSFGYSLVNCVEKKLACGDYGMGGMAPVSVIVDVIEAKFSEHTI